MNTLIRKKQKYKLEIDAKNYKKLLKKMRMKAYNTNRKFLKPLVTLQRQNIVLNLKVRLFLGWSNR